MVVVVVAQVVCVSIYYFYIQIENMFRLCGILNSGQSHANHPYHFAICIILLFSRGILVWGLCPCVYELRGRYTMNECDVSYGRTDSTATIPTFGKS